MTVPPQPRGPARRLVQNPLSSIVLVAAVLVLLTQLLETHHPRRSIYCVRDHDELGKTSFRMIDPDESSWSELAQLTQDRPGDISQVRWATIGRAEGGLFFPTRISNRPEIISFSQSLSPEDTQSIHAALLQWLDSKGYQSIAAKLRQRDSYTIKWSGYPLNAFAFVVCGLMLWSWGWVFQIKGGIRASRYRRGVCVQCQYDLSATPHNHAEVRRCPECGTLNPRAAST